VFIKFDDLASAVPVTMPSYWWPSFKMGPRNIQESPLPPTDPHDAMAQRMLNIPYRIMAIKLFIYSA